MILLITKGRARIEIHHLRTDHQGLINSALILQSPIARSSSKASGERLIPFYSRLTLVDHIWRPNNHLPVLTARKIAVPQTHH